MVRSDAMSPDKGRQLLAIYQALEPFGLLRHIRQACQHLWTLADPSGE
jgi:hypothetical protein